MLGRDGGRVADPLADGRQVILPHQFRFPARPKVLEQTQRGGKASAGDDPLKLPAQVQASQPVLGEDMLGARFSFVEGLLIFLLLVS